MRLYIRIQCKSLDLVVSFDSSVNVPLLKDGYYVKRKETFDKTQLRNPTVGSMRKMLSLKESWVPKLNPKL